MMAACMKSPSLFISGVQGGGGNIHLLSTKDRSLKESNKQEICQVPEDTATRAVDLASHSSCSVINFSFHSSYQEKCQKLLPSAKKKNLISRCNQKAGEAKMILREEDIKLFNRKYFDQNNPSEVISSSDINIDTNQSFDSNTALRSTIRVVDLRKRKSTHRGAAGISSELRKKTCEEQQQQPTVGLEASTKKSVKGRIHGARSPRMTFDYFQVTQPNPLQLVSQFKSSQI